MRAVKRTSLVPLDDDFFSVIKAGQAPSTDNIGQDHENQTPVQRDFQRRGFR